MSFVDLMGRTTYTEAQIIKRTEGMIRRLYSQDDENILNRKATAALLGSYVLTETDQAELDDYAQICANAQVEAQSARVDNELLKGALAYESATVRLARYRLADGKPEVPAVPEVTDEFGNVIIEAKPAIPAIEPIPELVDSTDEDGNPIQIPNPIVVKDDAERATAQIIINETSQEVVDLCSMRSSS